MKKEQDAISAMFEYLIKHINNPPAIAELVIQMSKEMNGNEIQKAVKNATEKNFFQNDSNI